MGTMKARDFRLYRATTNRERAAIYLSIARVRAVLAGRLATAALRGRLHYFEITTVEGSRHYFGVPDESSDRR